MMESVAAKPLLQVKGLSKSFPGVQALDRISLELLPRDIHAVCGENGAGKSTLMNILSGAQSPDSGEILLDGSPVLFSSPVDAYRLGISMIHQEVSLTPQLTVAENVFSGILPTRYGTFVNWRRLIGETDAVMKRLGTDFDGLAVVSDLSPAQRQQVEIAKALVRSSRILILDEPTAALTPHETASLFKIIRQLRDDGLGILYVSHRLEEIFGLADRITVLRDGKLVSTSPISQTNTDEVVRQMIGRELIELEQPRTSAGRDTVLTVRHLTSRGSFEDVDFQVRAGEIVGMYGLVGSGRTEVARAIFGLDARTSGTVLVGDHVVPAEPWAAMASGVVYASEDRKSLGLVLGQTVQDNISLPVLDRQRVGVFWVAARARDLARESVRLLDIRPPRIGTIVRNLSGGNQQKVVLAKCLSIKPRIALFDEPTRGVDVGAKREIYALLRRLADNGMAVVFISSDLPEHLIVPDRVLVMRAGRIVGEVSREVASEERLMRLATGAKAGAYGEQASAAAG